MKNLYILLAAAFVQIPSAYASECDALDVFEEFEVSEIVLKTEDFSILGEKNNSINGVLNFNSDTDAVNFEITETPKHGNTEISDCRGGFTYTPDKDFSGEDSFSFRICSGGEFSNISSCKITIWEKENNTEPIGFVYEDMRTHWGNYSAQKLVEYDIVKGERIGNGYYFYPETKMRRLDAAEYILAALKANYSSINKNETHIFADSASLPEYVNKTGYLANKAGFLEGVREGEKIYFRPYEYVTRAEIIKMTDAAIRGKTQNGDEIKFTDERSIPDWAVQSVKNLVGYGIVKGFEDNTLRPHDNITKAQLGEMIYQMMKYNDENSSVYGRIRHELYGNYMV